MADIDDTKAAQTSKLVGSDSDGTEQSPVESTVDSDGKGRLLSNIQIQGDNGNIAEVNPDGTLPAAAKSVVISSNSTTSTLGAAGEFTGSFVDVSDKNIRLVTVSVNTDQDSAIDGLAVEWSHDGSIVDHVDVFSIKAGDKKAFSFGVVAQFFRIHYINGSTPQGVFRLQTMSHPFDMKPSSHRVDETINGEDDATLSKAVITGKDDSGIFRNVSVDLNGNLHTTPADGSAIIPTLGTNLVYDDMNASTGGIARGTTIASTDGWVKVYDSTAVDATAEGLVMSFLLSLGAFNSSDSSKRWEVRLVVGGVEVFGSTGIKSSDLVDPLIYGYQDDPTKAAIEWNGFMVRGSVLRWEGPVNLPITYDSSGVQVFVRKFGDTKAFNAGLITLTRG